LASNRSKARSWLARGVRRLPAPRDEAAVETARSLKRLVTGAPAKRPQPTGAPGTAAKPSDPAVAMQHRLDRAFRSGRLGPVRRVGRELQELTAHAERLATPEELRGKRRLSEIGGARAMAYMTELLPHIQQFLREHPQNTRFDVLDVGPGAGHGTALLSSLYRANALGYRMRLSALDIVDDYAAYFAVNFPDIKFFVEDAFDHQKTYDIVISTHAIEHIADPVGFCRRLQELARGAVFVSAPFNEPADKLTKGHINVIDDALVEKLGADEVHIHKSAVWGAFVDPPYDSVIVRLPGLAPPRKAT
jgi:SAM-dependent methyltransferase